jgi:predicted glycosyltransferase
MQLIDTCQEILLYARKTVLLGHERRVQKNNAHRLIQTPST